ncbi:diiron oxygenase [Pseudomonas sp. MAFF 301381]|uniref:Diiron oxygenase n=2 Tax=Pseudomonas lactucae TaxID=2813360 RepID=A0A9X0Y9E1_9PSED|nr:diiron oxygenase [Pseudomonas lactucae]
MPIENSPMNALKNINELAHINYLHPNRMEWTAARTDVELQFLSTALVGEAGQEEKAVAYLYKELGQLAEIEMHVANTMTRILGEAQSDNDTLGAGDSLYGALSCFAAEEINHASSFYQYIRHLSGRDIKLKDNLFNERRALYDENDSPRIKLAALCATAYVGESIITVFERRLKVLDPMQRSLLTRLLHFHGLDEARHIQFDHFVFEHVIPSFTASERRRMHQLIHDTEAMNTQLAITSGEQIKAAFNLDYTQNNKAAQTQLDMTLRFREIVQSQDLIRTVDEHMDVDTADIVKAFSRASTIHTQYFH